MRHWVSDLQFPQVLECVTHDMLMANDVLVLRSTLPTPREQEYRSLCRAVLSVEVWLFKMESNRKGALGYSTDQIMITTGPEISSSNKLELLLDSTATAHGYELAMALILQACEIFNLQ